MHESTMAMRVKTKNISAHAKSNICGSQLTPVAGVLFMSWKASYITA